MSERTHVFVTDEGPYGFSMTSPQLPGFYFARPTQSELVADYQDALRREGVRGEVVGHWQIRGVAVDGQEFVIRWCTEADSATERQVVGNRLLPILSDAESIEQIAGRHETDVMGVITFVCCLPGDTLGWIVEQLNDSGDVVVACVAVADRMIFGIDLASSEMEGWESLAEAGFSLTDTIGDLMVRSDGTELPDAPLLLRA